MMLNIISIAPSRQNTNGDSENAAVLATRARWAGLDARVVGVERLEDLPDEVHGVVIGSGSDASLPATREVLLPMHDMFRRWGTEGVPILAVGTGWELLSWGIEFADGTVLEGLGVLPGRAVAASARVTDDLVIRTPRFGTLIGFENHSRAYVGAEGSPLGRVQHGIGNGRDSGQEGVVMGDVIGTHLHGPILAKNPTMADALLTRIAERSGLEYQRGERASRVDAIAADARNAQLHSAGISTERAPG